MIRRRLTLRDYTKLGVTEGFDLVVRRGGFLVKDEHKKLGLHVGLVACRSVDLIDIGLDLLVVSILNNRILVLDDATVADVSGDKGAKEGIDGSLANGALRTEDHDTPRLEGRRLLELLAAQVPAAVQWRKGALLGASSVRNLWRREDASGGLEGSANRKYQH